MGLRVTLDVASIQIGAARLRRWTFAAVGFISGANIGSTIRCAMAGHSKFKNIMHRKGRQDAVRSKQFAKLSKEITVASKLGGPDPDGNPRLRLAIANARGQSMPKDNIQRAVSKGQAGDGDDYFEIRYEGYGPGGTAIIVECLTDNKNRTAGAVRSYFTKNGGQMGETGSVAFMFDRVGEIKYPVAAGDEDTIMEAAIEAGADDVTSDMDEEDGGHVILTEFESLGDVASALESTLGEAESVNPSWKPQNTVPVNEDKAGTLMKLIDALEDDDDVQNVYSNFEIDDAVMEKLSAA